MPTVANEPHRRIVKCLHAFRVHPEMHVLMKASRRTEFLAHAERVERLLPADDGIPAPDSTKRDEEHGRTHALLDRLQYGVNYVYAGHPDILTGMGSLTLGDSPAEDKVKLSHLLTKVQEVQEPKMLWIRGEVTPDIIKAQLEAHAKADETYQKSVDSVAAEAGKLEELRTLRPATDKMWDSWLSGWVEASVDDHEEAVTVWGLERKHRGRKAKEGEGESKNKETSDKGQGGESKGQTDSGGGEQKNTGTTGADQATGTGG